MKTVIKILSIYLLALSLVPCGDGGGGIVEILNHLTGTEHQHISDHDQHSNSCGDDSCTPFCVCNCCSTVVDTPVKLPFQIAAPPPIPSKIPAFSPNINPSSFLAAVWQPPRFS